MCSVWKHSTLSKALPARVWSHLLILFDSALSPSIYFRYASEWRSLCVFGGGETNMGVVGCCITGWLAGLWPGYGGGACCPGGPRIPICNDKVMERSHFRELQVSRFTCVHQVILIQWSFKTGYEQRHKKISLEDNHFSQGYLLGSVRCTERSANKPYSYLTDNIVHISNLCKHTLITITISPLSY